MAGELHDNAEKQTLAPVGVQSDGASLSQNTQTLFTPLSGIRAASELPKSLDLGSPADIYGKDNVVAQRFDYDGRPPTLLPGPEAGLIMDAGAKIAGAVADAAIQNTGLALEKQWNPYRGDITAEMSKIPETAWHQAYEAFPQFKQAGLTEQQAKEIMQAIIRNELYNYNAADKIDDEQTRKNGKPLDLPKRPANDATLGDSQLSINAVVKRAQEYPEQIGQFTGHEVEALLDRKNAPLLVAATLAHNLEMYKRHNIPVTEQSLAYSYNPPGGRILPGENDLKSEHVLNVMHQLGIIRGQVEPKPGER